MEINELITFLFTPAAQVALIIALAELIKGLGLDHKYIPLVDVALGLICGIMSYTVYQGFQPVEGIVIGLAMGLSACGLFSGIKNIIK